MQILQKPRNRKQLFGEAETVLDETFIKGVVDLGRQLLAVDAPMHADLEQLLLTDGARQEDLWGINLYRDDTDWPDGVEFDSIINIRPRQQNHSRDVEDTKTQAEIIAVVKKWLI